MSFLEWGLAAVRCLREALDKWVRAEEDTCKLIAQCDAREAMDLAKAMLREADSDRECVRCERKAMEEECAWLSKERSRLLDEVERLGANARRSKDKADASKEKMRHKEVLATNFKNIQLVN
jgi:hypothetical protein